MALRDSIVTIKYKSSYGTVPSDCQITATTPLTTEHLPTLSADDYKFLGWVHINPFGHESSLSERMILSTQWLIPTNEIANEYSVILTAKWVNDRQSGTATGKVYDGDYVVIPKVTEQTLETAEKYMEDDVTVKSIPYFNVSNPSGGNTVYIGSEV